MFSSDGVQPVPIQLIKPTPGQLIQQVIDENGVTHLILSSQQQQQTGSGDGPAANDSYNQNLPSGDLIQSAPNEVNFQKVPVSSLLLLFLSNYGEVYLLFFCYQIILLNLSDS